MAEWTQAQIDGAVDVLGQLQTALPYMRSALGIPGTTQTAVGGQLQIVGYQLQRTLGLLGEYSVRDDFTHSNGRETGFKIYCYNSAANAALHDKSTGLLFTYVVSMEYTNADLSKYTCVKL